MEFGIFSEFHMREGATPETIFDEAFRQIDAAEEMGIDSVWLAEYHFSPERSLLSCPLVIASSVAARTRRIRIGLGVQVLPITNPLRVAEEAATVDHISGGRLDFGVGRSALTKYYDGYNIPYSESRGRFKEALEVILKAWCEDEFSYSGEFFNYNQVTLVPKPLQTPHPPVRVASSSTDTYASVGRAGHSLMIIANLALSEMQDRLKYFREARRDAGHEGDGDVMLRIPVYLAETGELARSEPQASTMREIHYSATELAATAASEETRERVRRLAGVPYEDILGYRVMYGTPEEVVDRLREYRERLGITGAVLEVNYGGLLPHDRVVNSMRLLAEKVMPQFR